MAPGSTATRLLAPWSTTVMKNVVLSSDSGDMGLGVIRPGVTVGQALAQSGGCPERGEEHQAEEDVAVACELRQEDQRRAHQREGDEREHGNRHAGPAQIERA